MSTRLVKQIAFVELAVSFEGISVEAHFGTVGGYRLRWVAPGGVASLAHGDLNWLATATMPSPQRGVDSGTASWREFVRPCLTSAWTMWSINASAQSAQERSCTSKLLLTDWQSPLGLNACADRLRREGTLQPGHRSCGFRNRNVRQWMSSQPFNVATRLRTKERASTS